MMHSSPYRGGTKGNLVLELSNVVKSVLRERNNAEDGQTELSGGTKNAVCNVTEAIFLHGLKDKLYKQHMSVVQKYPEPAWIRVTLNEGTMENYVDAMAKEPNILKRYYTSKAFLRDSEQVEIMRDYMKALSSVDLKLPVNSSILNSWTPTPLLLAGLMNQGSQPLLIGGRYVIPEMEEVDVPVGTSALEFEGLEDSYISSHNRTSSMDLSSNFSATNSDGEESFVSHNSLVEAQFQSILRHIGDNPDRDFLDSGIQASHNLPNDEEEGGVDEREKVTVYSSTATPGAGGFSPESKDDRGIEKTEASTQYEAEGDSLLEPETAFESEHSEIKPTPSLFPSQSEESPPPTSDHESESGTPGTSPSPDSQTKTLPMNSPHTADDLRAKMANFSPGNSLLIGGGGWSEGFNSCIEGDFLHRDEATFQCLLQDTLTSAGALSSSPVITTTVEEDTREQAQVTLASPIPEIGTAMSSLPNSPTSRSNDFVVLSDTSPSKESRTSQITSLPAQKGLDAQNFKCNSCAKLIGLMYGEWRVCGFDGAYYCLDCESCQEMPIPARILFSWDFRTYPVSRCNKAFLELISQEPLIDINKHNVSLYDYVTSLNEIRALRVKLSYLAMYLLTCKESVCEELRKRLWPKEYLFENVHLYSIQDLFEVNSGSLKKSLVAVINFAMKHVYECRLCAQKGFFCEICNDGNIIYPFQTEDTERCPDCFSVSHKSCIKEKVCPKCARRDEQNKRCATKLDGPEEWSENFIFPF